MAVRPEANLYRVLAGGSLFALLVASLSCACATDHPLAATMADDDTQALPESLQAVRANKRSRGSHSIEQPSTKRVCQHHQRATTPWHLILDADPDSTTGQDLARHHRRCNNRRIACTRTATGGCEAQHLGAAISVVRHCTRRSRWRCQAPDLLEYGHVSATPSMLPPDQRC
jgi:hypothetical protein